MSLLLTICITEINGQNVDAKNYLSQEECKSLVFLRDSMLLAQFDKVRTKYAIKADAVNTFNKLKMDLYDNHKWTSTNFLLIAMSLKTVANCVEDILVATHPPAQLMKGGSQISLDLYKWAKDNQKKIDKDQEDLTKVKIYKDMEVSIGGALSLLSKRLGGVHSFIKNLNENVNNFIDLDNYRSELKLQMKSLDDALANYTKQMAEPQNNFEIINDYKNYIDKFLSDNCGKQAYDKEEKRSMEVRQLLASYQNDKGEWLVMCPYNLSDPCGTEAQAMESMLYRSSDMKFLCTKGKYKIYELKDAHRYANQTDVRNWLEERGIKDIPR